VAGEDDVSALWTHIIAWLVIYLAAGGFAGMLCCASSEGKFWYGYAIVAGVVGAVSLISAALFAVVWALTVVST
jgi:uncharacterized membrane protein YeaQ/YmgE (transglycosylase-associated protein family)